MRNNQKIIEGLAIARGYVRLVALVLPYPEMVEDMRKGYENAIRNAQKGTTVKQSGNVDDNSQ